tara:strand:+ start:570 stop:1331 length:762 start_codon:yes stop_codon:yes gene_type:complete
MLYDFVYGVFMISLLYISADLLNKYNRGEISNNEELSMFLMEKGFKALKIYNKTKLKTLKFVKKCKKKKTEKIDDSEYNETYKISFIGENGDYFKGLLDFSEKEIYLENNDNLEENKKFSIIFIFNKEKKCYVQFDLDELDIKNEENIEKMKNKIKDVEYSSKLFINSQITFTNNDKEEEYDINEYLSKYFCAGNKILSSQFLKYFMNEHYDVAIPETYILSVMDKNIVMMELNNKDNIEIFKDDDEITYKKI